MFSTDVPATSSGSDNTLTTQAATLESLVGARLPSQFRAYLLGETPAPAAHTSYDVVSETNDNRTLYTFVIARMLKLDAEGPNDIGKHWMQMLAEAPRADLLPVAYDRFCNVTFIWTLTGELFFWDRSRSLPGGAHKADGLHRIAPDFDAFLAQLYRGVVFS